MHKLVVNKGYPDAIRQLKYDPTLAMRGLMVDQQRGNVFKPDRYGTPGRALHGARALTRAEVATNYHQHRLRLGDPRYAWIDSLFALPEAVLYVNLVEFFDAHAGDKPSYGQLWKDIRECIDLAHRDGSIKTLVAKHMPTYIERDPGLAEALHRFRSSG
jgi:HAD superfamily 5'-nucleotidase-like hydrolase